MKKDKLKLKITIQIEKNGQLLEPMHGNQLIQEFELEENQTNDSIWFSVFTLLNTLPFELRKILINKGVISNRKDCLTFRTMLCNVLWNKTK
ncbi:hypothetical protein V3Q90_12515 [Flavobacterium oreochromis]|uniref:hypothetical protein n=1 Tax=Flavobacterium oreochromis TaxID=2906078 RepID=UPI00385F0B39